MRLADGVWYLDVYNRSIQILMVVYNWLLLVTSFHHGGFYDSHLVSHLVLCLLRWPLAVSGELLRQCWVILAGECGRRCILSQCDLLFVFWRQNAHSSSSSVNVDSLDKSVLLLCSNWEPLSSSLFNNPVSELRSVPLALVLADEGEHFVDISGGVSSLCSCLMTPMLVRYWCRFSSPCVWLQRQTASSRLFRIGSVCLQETVP